MKNRRGVYGIIRKTIKICLIANMPIGSFLVLMFGSSGALSKAAVILSIVVIFVGVIIAFTLMMNDSLDSFKAITEYDDRQRYQLKLKFYMIEDQIITVFVWSNVKEGVLDYFMFGKKYIFHQNGKIIRLPKKQILCNRMEIIDRYLMA